MTPSFRFRPHVIDVTALLGAARDDMGELLARLSAHRGRVALDSAGGRPRRFSLLAFDPVATGDLAFDRAEASVPGLRSFVAELETRDQPVPGPFAGGFLGALSYDLGVPGETSVSLPSDPWDSPRVLGGLFVDFLVVDHEQDRAWLVLGDEPGDDRPPLAERRAQLLEQLARPTDVQEPHPVGPLVRHTPPAEHRRRIEVARASIAVGDYYQANLAHRFTRRVSGTAEALYRRLRLTNPAPYMAFVEDGSGWALCSASPELLLETDGVTARTRPIKGTARRPDGADIVADERAARRLLASEKDRAELAMIVDLERNDLGRVARAGSVRVEAFPRLESYATVHHLVADVSCKLRDDVDAVDALCALFPGGSITGAPKLASMRAIAALEGEGRGFFTGSAGFLDTRGHAAFNILIRTLVWRDADKPGEGDVSFHVGGGITWSSSASAEDQETLDKGAALAAALDNKEAALATGPEGVEAPVPTT
jgi:para-aminobenzoate synthetase component 1